MTATAVTTDLMAQLQNAWRSSDRSEPASVTTSTATVSPEAVSPAKLPNTPTEPKRPDSSTGRTSSSSLALAHPSCGADPEAVRFVDQLLADIRKAPDRWRTLLEPSPDGLSHRRPGCIHLESWEHIWEPGTKFCTGCWPILEAGRFVQPPLKTARPLPS